MVARLSWSLNIYYTMGLKTNGVDKRVDKIEPKLDTLLGLKIPKQIRISHNVKTPSTWTRIRGDKACISGHGPQNQDGTIAGPYGKVDPSASEPQVARYL